MTLLEARDIVQDYTLPSRRPFGARTRNRALHGVSISIASGTSLGIVGASGSGKSTLARIVLALQRPVSGEVRLLGQNLHALPPAALRAARRAMQAVFQDPNLSLDPRLPVGRSVAEPIAALEPLVPEPERRARVAAMLEAVGLQAASARKYPHEFSGGERQRVAIARALVIRPALIVADEPVSALDVSVQAQVLNLMRDLRARFGLAYLFISHDLHVVRLITDHVAVLYQGRIVEAGPTGAVFSQPRHFYTRALIAARPGGGRRLALPIAMPLAAMAGGCPFAPDCPAVTRRCEGEVPALREVAAGHHTACHLAE